MTRTIFGFGLVFALVGCDSVTVPGLGGGGTGGALPAASGGFNEYLVLGSAMPFEECRARGGIIIRDQGSPMVACDPRVRREPVPANEFDHPGSPVPQIEAALDGAVDG